MQCYYISYINHDTANIFHLCTVRAIKHMFRLVHDIYTFNTVVIKT